MNKQDKAQIRKALDLLHSDEGGAFDDAIILLSKMAGVQYARYCVDLKPIDWKKAMNGPNRKFGQIPAAKEKKEPPVCCVADGGCLAAANFENRPSHIGTCNICGEDVCRNCSSIRNHVYYGMIVKKRARICNNCQVEMDGHERKVMARMRRQAGYKK